MKCPNKSHPDWKALVGKVGVRNAYHFYFENDSNIPDPSEITGNLGGTDMGIPVLNFLESDMGQKLSNQLLRNKEKFLENVEDLIGPDNTKALANLIEEKSLSKVSDIVEEIKVDMAYSDLGVVTLNDAKIATFEEEVDSYETREIYNIQTSYDNKSIVDKVLKRDTQNLGFDRLNITDEGRDFGFNVVASDRPSTNETELRSSLNKFFATNSFDVQSVSQIIDPLTGEKMSANAMTDLVNRVVLVMEDKMGVDTLPEEAGHVMVAMLGDNHPLVKSMVSEIEQYEIYQEVLLQYSDVYKGDINKLKKEAIGKVIAKKIIGEEVEPISSKEGRIDRWWNRVLKAIKNIVGGLKGLGEFQNTFLQTSPFGEVARMIVENDFVNSAPLEQEYYYQLSQNEIVNNIKNKHKITKDNEGYTIHKDGTSKRVKRRVTDRTKNYLRKIFGQTSISKFAEITAEWGTKGHADVENIINRAVANRNKTPVPARVVATKESVYSILETYFTKFIEDIPASSVILTEVMLYNPDNNEGGTIDFLAVHEDGSASIFDWKFMNFGKMKEVKWYKKEAFNIQLDAYVGILLKEYGVKSFRELRIIPIEAVYENEDLKGIKIGSNDIENFTPQTEHLLPVPILSERTGNPALDRIIENLIFEKNKIQNTQIPTNLSEEERQAAFSSRNIKLAQIARSISDIQLKHDLTEFINIGKQLNDTLENSDLSEYSQDELLNMLETKLHFYGKDLIETLSENLGEQFNDIYEDLTAIAGKASVLSAKVKSEIERRVLQDNPEILNPQKNIGWWEKNFRTFFNQDNPVIGAFAELIKRSNRILKTEYDEVESKVRASMKNLKDKGINDFSWMITENDKGRLRVASITSKQFQEDIENAREVLSSANSTKPQKLKAREFMLKHFAFDSDRFAESLEKHKKKLEERQKKEGFSNEMFATETSRFIDRFSNNNSALGNKNNWNLKLKDNPENYSEEYKSILRDPAKKEFFDLYKEYTAKYQTYIGDNRDSNFIWNVPVSLTEGLVENGVKHIINKESWLNYYKAQEYEYFANTDPNTGEVILQVPKLFNRDTTIEDEEGNVTYDTRLQSRDLGSVLLNVAGMAINHKNMLDIEGNSILLKHIMAQSQVYVTDKYGKLVKDGVTGKLKTHINNANNQDALRKFMEYYLYGRKIQHKDHKIGGLSSVALLKSGMSFFRTKALAFNPMSIIANSVGGHLNAVMLGASNRYFRTRDFEKSIWELGTANEKTHAIRKFMNIEEGENYRLRTNNKSMSTLKKLLTEETAFIGQRVSDWPTKQGLMLAMMKHYKVVDGKVVKKSLAPAEAPTLYEYAEITEESLTFKDVPAVELEKFREKVLAITDIVLGTGVQHNDLRLINTNIFGDMLLMFRSWLPRTFDTRWAELRKHQTIDEWEMGRYRSFINNLVHGVKGDGKVATFGGLLGTAKDLLLGFGTFGMGQGARNSTIEHAKVLYAEAVAKDPSLTISEQEYIEVHLGNIRASMIELYLILGIISVIALAAPDDDEKMSELSGGRRFLINSLSKFQTELLTYMSPSEFENLIKRPVPFIRFYTDLTNLVKTNTKYGLESLGVENEGRKNNAVRRSWFQTMPFLAGIESVMQYIEDDYNSISSSGASSKSGTSR